MKLFPQTFVLCTLALQLSTGCGGGEAITPLTPASGGTTGSGTGGTTTGGMGAAMPENPDGGDPAGQPGDAPITAVTAGAAMGRGVNLGQMFENTQHPRTLEAATAKIDAYYERGFRNLRIPITWTEDVGGDLLVNDPTVGDINPDHPRLAVIKSVVDYALSKPDLYVVINAHHERTLKDESRSAVLERLWQGIVEHFGDRDHRLLFEVLNEPHRADDSPMPAADLRLMTGLAYSAIRAKNPTRIVIIGGNQWFAAEEVPKVWTSLSEVGGGEDPYVMATYHHYNPWTFSGSDQGSYDDAWVDSDVSQPMETMDAWSQSVGNGMPSYIGEWGVGWGSRYQTMTCNNIRQWYTTFESENASPRGQPTAVWDDGGWFKIFDHATNSFDNNLIDCIEGTCEWEGTERFNAGCE